MAIILQKRYDKYYFCCIFLYLKKMFFQFSLILYGGKVKNLLYLNVLRMTFCITILKIKYKIVITLKK